MRILSLLTLSILLFTSCGNNDKTSSAEKRTAKGGVKYGGVFRYNEVEYLKTLYPQGVTEVTGHRITNQIYEGLVYFNQKDLTVEPLLAKSWDVDSSSTVYTFHLHTGVGRLQVLQAPHEQSCTKQQQEAQGHLRRDESLAKEQRFAGAGHRAAGVLQRSPLIRVAGA